MNKYQYNKAASMFDGLLRQSKTRAPPSPLLLLLLQLEHYFQGNRVCQGSTHHCSNVLTTRFQWPIIGMLIWVQPNRVSQTHL